MRTRTVIALFFASMSVAPLSMSGCGVDSRMQDMDEVADLAKRPDAAPRDLKPPPDIAMQDMAVPLDLAVVVDLAETDADTSDGGVVDGGGGGGPDMASATGFKACVTQDEIDNQGGGTIGWCKNPFQGFACVFGMCADDATQPGDPVCSPNCVCAKLPPLCPTDGGTAGDGPGATGDGGADDAGETDAGDDMSVDDAGP